MTTLQSKFSIEKSVAMTVKLWADARSKDPSTKVGAGIYDKRTGALHLGYNGFPHGILDTEAQWLQKSCDVPRKISKYDLVVHAEKNAMVKALSCGSRPEDMMLVCTHAPCAQCWRDVIATIGIRRVLVINKTYPSRTPQDDAVAEFFIHKLGINYEVFK